MLFGSHSGGARPRSSIRRRNGISPRVEAAVRALVKRGKCAGTPTTNPFRRKQTPPSCPPCQNWSPRWSLGGRSNHPPAQKSAFPALAKTRQNACQTRQGPKSPPTKQMRQSVRQFQYAVCKSRPSALHEATINIIITPSNGADPNRGGAGV